MDSFDKRQQEDPKIKVYTGLLKILVSAVRKLPMYPSQHPMIKDSIRELFVILQRVFLTKKEISVTWQNDRFFIDEVTLDKMPVSHGFVQQFRQQGIESLTFLEGVTEEELTKLLEIISQKTELPKGKILRDVFAAENIEHIQINTIRYEKVSDEQRIISKDEQVMKGLSQPDEAAVLTGQKEGTDKTTDEGERKDRGVGRGPDEGTGERTEAFADEGITEKEVKEPMKLIVQFLSSNEPKERITITKEEFINYIKRHTRSITGALIKKFGRKIDEQEILQQISPQFDKLGINGNEKTEIISSLENFLSKKALAKKSHTDFIKQIARLEKEKKDLVEKVQLFKQQEEKYEALRIEHKKIKKNKERIETVIRSIAEGLVVVDSDGKVLMLNPAAEKILGATREKKIGRFLMEELKEEHLVSFSKGKEALEQEIELRSKSDATKKTIKASSAIIENERGQTVGMVSVLSDITKQKELEQLKSNFVASVSHELRAPLIAIQKSISLMIEDEELSVLSPPQKRFLEIAQNNSRRLYDLINDLLDIAKLESGRVTLEYAPVDAGKLLQDVTTTLTPWADSKSIAIKVDYPEITFDGDYKYLSQTLTNLLGNAIKFTEVEGEIFIKAELVSNISDLPEGNYVKMSVKDTGIGIPQEAVKKIFDKFVQLKPQIEPSVRGTGLGLSIVRHVIDLHKGKIWIESEVGRGTEFSFVIPQIVKTTTDNKEE
ncbi:MAG: PAS domain-containing sensor histidine kinase [Candidatus Omnitrophota bacterium]